MGIMRIGIVVHSVLFQNLQHARSKRKHWSRPRLTFFLVVILACLSPASQAEQDVLVDFSILAQPLSSALIEFSRQAKVQVLTAGSKLENVNTGGVSGKFSVDAAMEHLLMGTGFGYRLIGSDTISLTAPTGQRSNLDPPTDVQVSPNASSDSEVQAPSTYLQSVEPTRTSTSSTQELGKVVVTGSRIPRTAKEGAQEIKVYTKQQIEQSGETTVADFLNTIPAVSASSVNNGFTGFSGPTTVRLRGLPVGMTLVLINGRRVENAGLTANSSPYFDLNNIPVAAIERIEVLPEGSSAIYGSDALGGVVNVILKTDFDGFEANAHYGRASGTDEASTNLAWGKQWSRGSVSIIASYKTVSELTGDERGLTANNNYLSYGGPNANTTTCSPGNAFSANGGNLNGLSSSSAAIPAGITGIPTVGNFSATAGAQQSCASYTYQSFIPNNQQASIFSSGDYKLAPSVTLFSEVLFTHYHNFQSSGIPSVAKITMPASNPYNPFGENVLVSTRFTNLNAQGYDQNTNLVRPLIGVKGSLFDKWDWELSAFNAQDHTSLSKENLVNLNAVNAALSSTDPNTALNLFVSNPASNLQTFLYSSPEQYFGEDTSANGFIRGPLFTLPSGQIELVVGGEYDRQKLGYRGTYLAASTDYHRDSYSFFTEARLPLLANHDDSRAGDTLAVTLADRYDNYDDFGGTTNPQYGIEWRPSSTILVRGAYGQSFRAPLLSYLDAPQSSVQVSGVQVGVDPERGGQALGTTTVISGGSRSLRPETGQSRSIGFVWSSKDIKDLETSLTYWGVDVKNRIALPAIQAIISNPTIFPGAVVRAQPTTQDIQNGYAGAITTIYDIPANFGALSVSGFDFNLSYKVWTSIGQLLPSISATETYKYLSALSPGQPPANNLSVANTDAFAPRWKGTVALGWKLGPYSANVDGRYIGRYEDYYPATFGVHEIGNFWLYDVNARYAVGQALSLGSPFLKGLYVEAGGVNLFNTIQYSNSYIGYDYQIGDIRGRFLYGNIGVRW